jgi:hypothetical protein
VTAQYWASGISATYLEGALARALDKPTPQIVSHAEPLFNEPAARSAADDRSAKPKVDAVLNPFSVYEKGETLLRQELQALSAWHLVNIAVAYDLTREPVTTLTQLPQQDLIELIVAAVRAHAPTP